MKTSRFILCIAAAALALSGCASSERWYAHQSGAGNPSVAWQICQARALAAVDAITCPIVCEANVYGQYGNANCKEEFSCSMGKTVDRVAANSGSGANFRGCMASKGFLPCSQGGLHLPECQ